jgi:hypothetical protein
MSYETLFTNVIFYFMLFLSLHELCLHSPDGQALQEISFTWASLNILYVDKMLQTKIIQNKTIKHHYLIRN